MQQFLLRSNIGVTSRGKYARAWDVHVEMAVIRSWGFPGAHDRYSSATVCHMAGVRSPCAEVRRIDNLFTISARARTSTRVRWRTAVIYAVTRNNSSAENREKIRKSLIILACLGKNEKSLSCYFCHVLFSFILVIVIDLNRVQYTSLSETVLVTSL